MASIEQLEAFVTAAETGSFSAAARRLGKAQSAVSTAVSNLELDADVELFDRSSRSPSLTPAGETLLEYARSVLRSQNEFKVRARALGESDETEVRLAIEQSISGRSLLGLLHQFEAQFPHIRLELLDPGGSDIAELIRTGRADLGLMLEREIYPQGFAFRGIGHSELVAVCHKDHPLADNQPMTHANMREHRQLVLRSLDLEDNSHERFMFSPTVWFSESPYIILELLCSGIGWSFLPRNVVADQLSSNQLVELKRAHQQVQTLIGLDLVWTENRALGPAANWLMSAIESLKM